MTPSVHKALVWSGSIIGLALLVWGLAYLGTKGSGSGSGPVAAVEAIDYTTGGDTATAVLIEYSDFQCPACAAYFPIVKQLKADMGDQLKFVYRHFPLRANHPHAQIAAQASEAAAKQNKFWEYHDILFERQSSWPKALDVKKTLIGYAEELKLNVGQFTTDLDSQETKDRVQRDVNSGNTAKVDATPTFFLNGQKMSNPGSIDDFKQAINEQSTNS